MDSSYHVQTNMGVERGIFWGISVHSIHEGEVFFFLLACTFQMAIKKFEVKMDLQKGALEFKEKKWQKMC